jgi:hypothetical protein
MIATAMPAAMRPYSMAVAPDSFFIKCNNVLHGWLLGRFVAVCLAYIGTFPAGEPDRVDSTILYVLLPSPALVLAPWL